MREVPSDKPTNKPRDSSEQKPAPMALIYENGEEKLYKAAVFLERFNVHNWVRFTPEEFGGISPDAEYIDHFNLGATDSEAGKRYIVVKILKAGTRASDTQSERPPLLALDGAFIVECEKIGKELPYSALTKENFEYALPGVTDVESLKATILTKYAKSRPHLTPEQMLKMGVTYTRLKIVGKVQS